MKTAFTLENKYFSTFNCSLTMHLIHYEILITQIKDYNSAKKYMPINGIIVSSIVLNDFLFTINIVLGYTKY